MLELKNIKKDYVSGDEVVHALKGVNVHFRESEFVAILGQSGCGKTTLLNIIGGLDQYTSGDLVINGTSTREYKDRDWDAYRNHSVGFVFQSYNLIPHQTVLSNVELALTLSGVSREERRRRATEALKAVGLGDQLHKKPNQMSGGQMQRVAIARALVNDPDIILADEPTGALDTATSVQVMDILREVANNRLVIMVTHNPELAAQYATRTIRLLDGEVQGDSNPYFPDQAEVAKARESYANRVKRTSMSFFTALSLSLNNLMTKKARTLLTAFAGSIGIIGIAAILALANGVNDYIASVEEDTLSEYPLSIQSSAMDMTSMLASMSGVDTSESADDASATETSASTSDATNNQDGETAEDTVRIITMITSMFDSIGSNDLASLKEYFDSGESGIDQYVNSIEYSYDVTPQVYQSNTENGVRQVNPDSSFSALGLGSTNSGNSLMSMTMSTDVFYELPSDTRQVEEQYDVVAGRWPEESHELVLVLTANGGMSDFMLYTLGLREGSELDGMVAQFANNEEVDVPDYTAAYTYEDILDVTFSLVKATDYYSYDEAYGVWTDKSGDEAYLKELVNNGEELRIVGIVQANPDANASSLTAGIYYPASLTTHIVDEAAQTQIVKDQLADPAKNVITGKSFAEEEEGSQENAFDMSTMFTIDGSKIQAAFSIDQSKLNMDLSGLQIDTSSLNFNASSLPAFDASSISMSPNVDLSQLNLDFSDLAISLDGITAADLVDPNALSSALSNVVQGFFPWWQGGNTTTTNVQEAFAEYLQTEAVQQQLSEGIAAAINVSGLQESIQTAVSEQLATQLEAKVAEQLVPAMQQAVSESLSQSLATAVQSYVTSALSTSMSQMMGAVQTQLTSAMQNSMSQLSTSLASAMSIDEAAFADAFQFNMDEQELGELMMSLMTTETSSYSGNLAKFGYADPANPAGIDIYPIDFDSKAHVIEILDSYNQRMEDEGETEKVITYTDLVGTLMSSVTDIVNMISYVLVAFVAISLVVSSIMIGVITYISVLERNKEIGILRAIGASKGDIGRVFNAETLIVGFVAGALGIGVTLLACIPANAIVYSLFDVANVAQLPWQAAVVLIGISMVLTFIAGLLPSSIASRKDPVVALRSE